MCRSLGGYDFVVYDAVMYKGKRQILQNGIRKTGQLAKCRALLTEMVVDGLFGFIHGIVYRRNFLLENGISFNEGTIQREDADFNFEVIAREPKIRYIRQNSYIYKYKAGNAIDRWRRHPDLMIKIGEERHQKELAFVRNQIYSRQKLLERRVDGIYQSAIDLCCAGRFTADRRREIHRLMEKVGVNTQDFQNQSTAWKYRWVMERRWLTMWVLAKARVIYLKARGYY